LRTRECGGVAYVRVRTPVLGGTHSSQTDACTFTHICTFAHLLTHTRMHTCVYARTSTNAHATRTFGVYICEPW
jgi:hypothetical protein